MIWSLGRRSCTTPWRAEACLLVYHRPIRSLHLQAAAQWAHAYITGPNDAADTLNLYDVSGAAHYELYRAIAQAGNPSGLAVTQADLLSDLKKQLDKAVAQAGTVPSGFGFTWAAFDTTSHGAGLVVMGKRVRSSHEQHRLCKLRGPVAGEYPGSQCLGGFTHCGRWLHLPALHAASSRQPRWLP